MARYIPTNSIIDAVKFTGNNIETLEDFLGEHLVSTHSKEPKYFIKQGYEVDEIPKNNWIIRSINGGFFNLIGDDEFKNNYTLM